MATTYKFMKGEYLKSTVKVRSLGAVSSVAALKAAVAGDLLEVLRLPEGATYEDSVRFEYEDEDGDWYLVNDSAFEDFSGTIKLRIEVDKPSRLHRDLAEAQQRDRDLAGDKFAYIMGKGYFTDAEALDKWLLQHGVSTLFWGTGKAKTVQKLHGELEGFESELCLKDERSPPLRVTKVRQISAKHFFRLRCISQLWHRCSFSRSALQT